MSSCPSVCLWDAWIVTKRNKSPPSFLYRMKVKFTYFFGHKEWLMGRPPCTWNFGSNWPTQLQNSSKTLFFQSIFACSGSALRPSEKSSIMTNGKSPTSFPMSLRWTAYVAPNPKRGLKGDNFFLFRIKKIRLFSNKVCYKVSLYENFQRQSCRAFTGLSNRTQTVGGRRPLLPEIFGKSYHPFKNGDFQSIFGRSAWTIAPSEKKFSCH